MPDELKVGAKIPAGAKVGMKIPEGATVGEPPADTKTPTKNMIMTRFGPRPGYDETSETGLPAAGGSIGGALGGVPGATLGAGAGEALDQLIRRAAGDKVTETPATDIATQAAVSGLFPEAGGKGLAWLGGKLSPLASQSLARILRVPAKAFMFGREPAQEVLERGLASGSLSETASSIGKASKEVTSQLNDVLKSTNGTVNIENHALDVANNLPGNVGNRFLQVVDEAAQKLGFRGNQLTNLTAAETNALKQEVAKQARFVEGDLKPTVANAARQFGGKLKDSLIGLNSDVEPLLESSANLTEASKAADFAVRSEKRGLGTGLLGGVQVNKPGTYSRLLTDRPSGASLVYRLANILKDNTTISNALRVAFQTVFPGASGSEE